MLETEVLRRAEIDAYAVLNRPSLDALHRLVALAARALGVGAAEVNLITDEELYVIAASYGSRPDMVVPRGDSLCGRILDEEGSNYVAPDTTIDPLLSGSPWVNGQKGAIASYAAQKLVSSKADIKIGTFCVYDHTRRTFSAEDEQALEEFGQCAMDVLESRRTSIQLATTVRHLLDDRELLLASNSDLESYATQVAHDLQTPLTGVRLALDLIKTMDLDTLDPDADDLMSQALRSIDRMRDTIVDQMSLATASSELAPSVIDLNAMVDEVRADLLGVTTEDQVSHDELPGVIGHPTQIRAVLQNLILNAIKHGLSEGDQTPVTVKVTGSVEADGVVRIVVNDDGRGVPVEERQLIFESRTRGTGGSAEGHGVGLWTCRRIIEANGGAIGVDDSPLGGAAFWFELPGPAAT